MSVVDLLKVEDVAARLGMSKRTLHGLTAARAIPHRVLPHGRRCLFEPAWLEQWANGCELETIELPHGGRIVRPKDAA
jgi:hypothetical protein